MCIRDSTVDPAVITIPEDGGGGSIELVAVSSGSWGSELLGRVEHDTADPVNTDLFNLKIKDNSTGLIETHLNLSASSTDARYIERVLAEESELVRSQTFGSTRPALTPAPAAGVDEFGPPADSNAITASTVTDGEVLTFNEIEGSGTEPKTGLHAFDTADIINLLCIPPYTVLDGGGLPLASIVGNEAVSYTHLTLPTILLV